MTDSDLNGCTCPGSRLWALAALVAVTFALFISAGCQRGKPPSVAPAIVTAQFVGDSACAQCHPAESSAHGKSNHAHTLRAMTRSQLGRLAPPSGPVKGTSVIIKSAGDAYQITAT